MKRFIFSIIAMTIAVFANAMSYEQARREALFLTDKMAYELNLSDRQYEAAYEINLDYLMRIDRSHDMYGSYWTIRNRELSYILTEWQYRAFCAANYFFRPVYWHGGCCHFYVYKHYPHRNHFYYNPPRAHVTVVKNYKPRPSHHSSTHVTGNGNHRGNKPNSSFGNNHGSRPGNGNNHGNVGGSRPGNGNNHGNVGGSRPGNSNKSKSNSKPSRSFGGGGSRTF